jgi:signal transduction histidine kinase
MRTEQVSTPATCVQLHCAREVAADLAVSRQIEFVAFVAHELRNPLGPIRTAAAMLTRANAKELEWAQHVIDRQVTHLSRMVEDLLDMARGHMGKLRLAIETIELKDCVELAASACRPAMERRRQRLEIRGIGKACPMQADAVRLTQILSNLLDNASKYSADGQVVRLDVSRLTGSVEVTVTDAGIGIAATALASVFEPFAQTAHAIHFNASGLGIGLAVARELAHSHGGDIAVTSDGIGLGSRFVVRLPLSQAAASQGA